MTLKTFVFPLCLSLLLAFEASAATNLTIANGGTDPISSASFGVSGDKTISPSTLATALGSGSVDLQANADTLFSNSVTASSGNNNLIVQSGRSISLGANVTLSLMGAFNAIAQDPGASSVPAGTPSFTMGSGSSISAPGGINISNNGGGLALAELTATASTVRLVSGGDVTQTAGITAAALGLRSAAFTSTNYSLTNSGNSVGAISAAINGNLTFYDSTSFTVGNLTSLTQGSFNFSATSGINATNVTLTSAGNIGINSATTATNNLSLTAAGSVTQSAALSATGLELHGAGSFTLTNASNHVSTLAANTTGNISYTDSGSFSVGTVNSTTGITASSATLSSAGDITISGAIGATNNVTLFSSGNIGINSGINATNNVSLNAAGSVTQSAAITSAGLELLGAASYTLTNSGNHVSTLAANTTADLIYVDSGAVTVGTVNSTTGIAAGNISMSTGADIAINGAISTLDTVRLSDGGGMTQTAAITAGALALRSTGVAPANYTLTNSGNNVGVIAASINGNLTYSNSASFTVGSVSAFTQGTFNFPATSGITANNVSLSSAGSVTQSAAVSASGLELLGAGSYTLTNAGNHVTTLAANTTGNMSYADSGSFTIGMVNSTTGIHANNLTLSATGITLSTTAHITASSVTFGAGTNLSLAVSAPVSSAIINGAVTFGQGIAFTLTTTNGYDPAAGDTFHLVDGTISGSTPSWVLPALDSGLSWDTSRFTNTGAIAVVPEPSTLALLGLGAAIAVRRRKK